MACGFAGNPDVYGVGIRIGYYSQAVAVWFSNFFFFREANTLRAANLLFLFALVIVGFIYTYNAGTKYVIEAFLLLQIGLCIAFISIMESTRFSSRYIRASGQRLALRTIIINAGLLFNVCFWWRGLDVMLPTPCDGDNTVEVQRQAHSTYACYAFRADIFDWMRTLMKVLSLASLVWTTQNITARDAGEVIQRLRMKKARSDFINFHPNAEAVRPEPTALKLANNPMQDYEKPRPDGATQLSPRRPRPRALSLGDLPPGILPPKNLRPRELNRPESERLRPPLALPPALQPSVPTRQLVPHEIEKGGNIRRRVHSEDGTITYTGIRDAELYLDSIFSVYTRRTAPLLGTSRFLGFYNGRKQVRYQLDPRSASYLQCAWTTIKSTWINQPPMDLRWRLNFHMAALGKHPAWRWPRFLHRMCQINETRQPPHWYLLAIASDAQLSQIPLTITPKIWTFTALENLAIIVALIVQVELTISWNHISGLQSLDTLGQLIPFILGVGGLLKVLWGKSCMVIKGIKEVPRPDERYLGEYEAAIGRYLKWKEETGTENAGSAGPVYASERAVIPA